jgi:hypothetical protein
MYSSMHEIRFTYIPRPVLNLVILCGLCVSISGQDWKTVHKGVEYAQVEHKLGNEPLKINLLRLDLTKVRLDVHHAFDKAIGLETTSAIATRHRAVAAINAGFFRLDKSAFAGDAAGLLMIDGQLLSESSNDRVGLVISNSRKRTEVGFGHFSSTSFIGVQNVFGSIEIDGINRERKASEVVLYTPEFGGPGPSETAAQLILSGCKRLKNYELRTVACRRYELLRQRSSDPVTPKGYNIYNISVTQESLEKLKQMITSSGRSNPIVFLRFKLHENSGDKISILMTDEENDITNGVPQLIKNAKIDITWQQEKASKAFVENRHPRTAIAKLKDGKFLMITVDGRQPGVSVGMTLQELADYLFSFGAVDAMNLDGGGSTTMFLDGKVVNTPSDKEGERKVSDAIVVTLRRK